MKTLAFVNLKGGVGKTVSAANMAHILASVHNKRVLLVDADKQGNVSQYFKLYGQQEGTGELLLGDIVLSVEKIREQAEEYGHSLKRELAFLTAHSMLHLMGYDHVEDEERHLMEERQRLLMKALEIPRE